jgi:hypothetical protein
VTLLFALKSTQAYFIILMSFYFQYNKCRVVPVQTTKAYGEVDLTAPYIILALDADVCSDSRPVH